MDNQIFLPNSAPIRAIARESSAMTYFFMVRKARSIQIISRDPTFTTSRIFSLNFIRLLRVVITPSVMHQSIPPAPRPPPPPELTPGISIFLPWTANSWGWGLLSWQIPRGGEKKEGKWEKRGQMPCPPSTVQHFLLIAQSNSAILKCDFLFQLTSSFAIALGF